MFQPENHGLEADFRLTMFSTLRGWGCKVPEEKLNQYLRGTEIVSKTPNNNDGFIGEF